VGLHHALCILRGRITSGKHEETDLLLQCLSAGSISIQKNHSSDIEERGIMSQSIENQETVGLPVQFLNYLEDVLRESLTTWLKNAGVPETVVELVEELLTIRDLIDASANPSAFVCGAECYDTEVMECIRRSLWGIQDLGGAFGEVSSTFPGMQILFMPARQQPPAEKPRRKKKP
jgi:hypothetical protein